MSNPSAKCAMIACTLLAAAASVSVVPGPSGVTAHSEQDVRDVPTATRLRVEYVDSPLGVDTRVPRFSWALEHPGRSIIQASYRLQVWECPPSSLDVHNGNSDPADVSSSNGLYHTRRGAANADRDLLPPGAVQVWDSGVVRSNRTLNIEYGGGQLRSDTDYVWAVAWTDSGGATSPQAQSLFSTGILDTVDWHGAQWISSPANGSLSVYRSEFTVTGRPIRARLYVAGLGYAKTWLNGNRTDANELGQFVTFQERVLYDCLNVTSLVREGVNALGVMLGNGWFAETSIAAGPRQFLLLLSVTTATNYDGSSPDHGGAGAGISNTVTYFASALSPTDSVDSGTHLNHGADDIGRSAASTTKTVVFTSTAGPATSISMDSGESYDGRIEASIHGWTMAGYTPAPGSQPWVAAVAPVVGPTTFGSQMSARTVPIITERDYEAVSITEPTSGIYVVDFGQNMAGQVTLRINSCPRGHVISMQHTEILYPDGRAHNAFCERPKYWLCSVQQMANYTCAGGGPEIYRVAFVYMGFRYVQIIGLPSAPHASTLTAHFVHSDVEASGSFVSSSSVLNAIQHATRFAALSNAIDIPTDCPQRERRGWLGDAQLAFETVVHNFDSAAFYTKWVRDLQDTQRFNNATLGTDSALPDCAPFYGHGKAESDPGWGIAGWVVPMGVAAFMDDARIERAWYPNIKAYADHWIKLATNNSGILPIVSYGDWGNLWPGPKSFKPALYPQYFYIVALEMQTQLATRLGLSNDAAYYSSHASAARAIFLERFFDDATGCYGNCSDVEQIFGMSLNLHPDGSSQQRSAWDNALAWFNATGKYPERFGGGIVSLKLLYPLLDSFNLTDLGLRFMLHTDSPPSLGYWMAQNATTLWEFWSNSATKFDSGLNSYNHIMYGSTGSWFYSTLAGLGRARGSRSWSDLVIAPPSGRVLANLTWANATIDTPMGFVKSAWASPGTGTSSVAYAMSVVIPPNARARVTVPTAMGAAASTVTEGGRPVWAHGAFVPGVGGIVSATQSPHGQSVVFEVGSGSYDLEVQSL